MLNLLRKAIKSPIGAAVALIALVLIALSFAGGDIAGLSGGGSGSRDKTIAEVGGKDIPDTALVQSAKSALSRVRQQQPDATMRDIIAQGALGDLLDALINRAALTEFGRRHGIVAGDRLVDSQIATLPAFQGLDGKFDQKLYDRALQSQGLTDKAVRDDLHSGLISRQLIVPAQTGVVLPPSIALRYARLYTEVRSGSVAILPAILFAPKDPPTDAQVQAYYKSHIAAFTLPERRTVRYATFGEDALKSVPAPTDAEIAARYEQDKAQYAAEDRRKFSQLVLPTEAAARALAAEVAKGTSLEAAARAKGLSASTSEFMSRDEIAGQYSKDLADAVFATDKGKLTAPARSPLGWQVARVDDTMHKPAKSLADARAEISAEIAADKKRQAMTDMLAGIEDKFADGSSLAEVAKSLGLTVQQTEPITSDGHVYGKPGSSAATEIQPLVKTAFTMDQEMPQVAEVERGKTFAIYDVSKIDASAPAPLAQIKDQVKLAWANAKGASAAMDAARKVKAAMDKGTSLDAALKSLGRPLPPIQHVETNQNQLAAARQAGRNVPPPVTLMFLMKQGAVKVQEADDARGWFVVQLDKIVPGNVDKGSPEVAGLTREFAQTGGQEMAEAFSAAIRKEVGVTRHAAAIKAVDAQLSGSAAGGN